MNPIGHHQKGAYLQLTLDSTAFIVFLSIKSIYFRYFFWFIPWMRIGVSGEREVNANRWNNLSIIT